MRIITLSMTTLLVTVLAVGTALGAGMPQTKVEYSADSTMESQGMTMTSKVFQAENKYRMEMKVQGANNIVINRMDKKLSWILMPDQKMYMENSLEEGKKKSNDINDCKIEQQQLGSEVVNGLKTTKNKIAMSCPDGLKYNGSMWVTKDGIMVKMDSVAKTDKGDIPFKMELKNINIAKQDPSLFEIPAGYQAMNMGGMMGAFGDMMKKATQAGEKKSKDEAAKKERDEAAAKRQQEGGRSYTAAPRTDGRSYTAEPRAEAGRSYTAQKKSGSGGMDPVKIFKDIFNKW
jgi:hypothetical protein